MSVSLLIDFFETEIEATNEFKRSLEALLDSCRDVDTRGGPFVFTTIIILKLKRILNLIKATEELRD